MVTVGLDDTTKAAGHCLYNVKADHITIARPSGKHYGEDGDDIEVSVVEEIVDAVTNQLSNTDYFAKSDDEINEEKMKYAP